MQTTNIENKKSETGKLGENIACEYLKKSGYMIVERNFRKPWGEIDVIAYAKDGTLVFVEVKALRSDNNDHDNDKFSALKPEDHLTKAKLARIKRTAALYTGNNQNLISSKRGWRIDLIAIDIPEWVSETNLTEFVKQRETSGIRYYESIT